MNIEMGTLHHLITHHLVGTPHYVRMRYQLKTFNGPIDHLIFGFFTLPDNIEIELGSLRINALWSRERVEWEINKLTDLLREWEAALQVGKIRT